MECHNNACRFFLPENVFHFPTLVMSFSTLTRTSAFVIQFFMIDFESYFDLAPVVFVLIGFYQLI